MGWWKKSDEYGIDGDIPGTRHALLQTTSKFNIYFFLTMGLMGASLAIYGTIEMARNPGVADGLKDVPEHIQYLVIGMIGFSLFMPLFTNLLFGRHFLRSIMALENEVTELKARLHETGQQD